MPVSESLMEEIRRLSPCAQEMTEGSLVYIFLPNLKHPCAEGVLDGLLCLGARDGYPTRLFLSQSIPARGQNWSVHTILNRTWHTWSWNYVPANDRPAQILAQHLRALK
jgi:hypothetical protein